MRDSSTYPVHTHSSGLPPSPAVSLHPPLYFQLAWVFKGFNIIFPVQPTVYTAIVSMGATVIFQACGPLVAGERIYTVQSHIQ